MKEIDYCEICGKVSYDREICLSCESRLAISKDTNKGERLKDIYYSVRREEVSPVPLILRVRRFKIDGRPVCVAWPGPSIGGLERMACCFLCFKNFGQEYVCGLTGEDIPDIEPIENCPLWAE
jgi:hypothetical protein